MNRIVKSGQLVGRTIAQEPVNKSVSSGFFPRDTEPVASVTDGNVEVDELLESRIRGGTGLAIKIDLLKNRP